MSDGHDHSHDHSHDHGSGGGRLGAIFHAHDHGGDARRLAANPGNRRALTWALAIAALFLVVEVVGGILTNSIALLSDAAHMFTDTAAYAIALVAARMAALPPTDKRTYGFARAEILAALANGALLLVASIGLVYEATRRLSHPQHVDGSGVAIVAAIGLVANLGIVWVLSRADHRNINIRGALLHGITDAFSSAYVLAAGVLVVLTGITRIDSIASYLIAALVLWAAWRLVRESVDVLLDVAPEGASAELIAAALLEHPAVRQVHDLHVWSFAPRTGAVSAHVRVAGNCQRDRCVAELTAVIAERFDIHHVTLQLTADREGEPIDTVDRMPVRDAIEWATAQLASSHPNMPRSVILAATGAAALNYAPGDLVSPVALSTRALRALNPSPTDPPAADS